MCINSGEDICNTINHVASRYAICFWDWAENEAMLYQEEFDYLYKHVKPSRDLVTEERARNNWWQFWCLRPELLNRIGRDNYLRHSRKLNKHRLLNKVILISRHTKYCSFVMVDNDCLYGDSCVVVASDNVTLFAILSSDIHNIWAHKFGTTIGNDTLRYSHTEIFLNFPFPVYNLEQTDEILNDYGNRLAAIRLSYMQSHSCGLTDFYNLFHNPDVQDAEMCSLREIQVQINERVMQLYGFDDIDLEMGFHRVEYNMPPDNLRFTMSESAREKVLARLCELNRERYEAEQRRST